MSPSVTATMADALVPIFAGLLLGYLAGRWHAMDNKNVETLNTFVTSFAIPCSIFLVVAGTPLRDLREQIASDLVLSITFIVLFAAVFL